MLLDSLKRLVTDLRQEIWQGRRCKKKTKPKKTQFNHEPAIISNMTTRSRGPISATDLPFATQQSRLTPGPFLPNVTEPPAVPQNTNLVDSLDVADGFETSYADHRTFALKAEATSAGTDSGTPAKDQLPAKDKLKQEIERCKETYRGKVFTVNGDERSETVYSDEINVFFSRFQEGTWLGNVNLMPLLFSFQWPSTTLMLHSSYMSFTALKNGSQHSNTRIRWSLRHEHDRIILPCCNEVHWTLYDVDLARKLIRHYDSIAEDISKSEEVISVIKERLAYAMEGWESSNLDFTLVSEIREILVLLYTFSITEDFQRSQQQENDDDCEIYMIYNADCLASNRDTLEKRINDVQLRYRYLERLLELERQERSERQILNMILPPDKTLRIKRRRVPSHISEDGSDQNQLSSRKSRRVDWIPPFHLGSQDAWIAERNLLITVISK